MSLKKNYLSLLLLQMAFLNACVQNTTGNKIVPGSSEDVKAFPEARPNTYWQKVLSPETYE
ncbi:MAG TPA: hypothetical protein VHS53_03055, partial [Mucilaginibacter sp.]|nr:hypothetical protein [Mucilaginibacter sp.]